MVDLKITIQAQDKSGATLDSLEGAFGELFQGIRGDLGELKKAFQQSSEDVVDAFKDVGDKIKSKVGSSGGLMGRGLGPIASMLGGGLFKLGGFVASALKGIGSIVFSALSSIPGIVVGIFETGFKAAVAVAGTIFSGIKGVVSLALQGIGGILDTFLLTPFRIVFNKITALAATIGVGAGLKFAADFQDSLSVAFALIPDEITDPMRNSMRRVLEEIRSMTGAGGRELGRSLFTAISTGFGEASPILVGAAAKLAAVGENADDVASTTQILAGILRAYNLEAQDAVKIADQLQMAQKLGNITNAEVASQLGRVVSAAKGADVALEDMLATISLSTVKGMTAEQAFTGLLGAIVALSAPTPEAKKKLADLNIELHDSQGQFVGLYEAISRIAKLNLDIQRLREIIPERMARNFFIAIAGSLDKYKEFIEEIKGATGVLDQAMEERNRSIKRQFERLGGNIANIFSTLLGFIDEDIATATGSIADMVDRVTEKLRALEDEGKVDQFKEAIGEAFDKIREWIPSLDEIKAGLGKVMDVGVTAFNAIGNEFKVFKKAFLDFTQGREADLSQSLLVTGAQLAFEYMKVAAAEAINWLKEQFSKIIDSDTGKALQQKAKVAFNLIRDEFGYLVQDLKITASDWLGGIFVDDDQIKKLREYQKIQREMSRERAFQALGEAIPIGKISVDTGNIDKLKDRLAGILQAARDEELAGELTEKVMSPIEAIVDQVKSIVEGPGLDFQPFIDDTHIIKSLIESGKYRIEEMKGAMRDFTAAQSDYYDEQGSLNQELVLQVRSLLAEIQAEKQKIAQLQEALGQ